MNGNGGADPDESFTAVMEQAQRCEQLLQKIQTANARILARTAAGEAVWQRVAKERYNNICRECAARRDNAGVPDAFLDAVSADTDLREVCDNRWLLGEAVDVLRSRLDRLDEHFVGLSLNLKIRTASGRHGDRLMKFQNRQVVQGGRNVDNSIRAGSSCLLGHSGYGTETKYSDERNKGFHNSF